MYPDFWAMLSFVDFETGTSCLEYDPDSTVFVSPVADTELEDVERATVNRETSLLTNPAERCVASDIHKTASPTPLWYATRPSSIHLDTASTRSLTSAPRCRSPTKGAERWTTPKAERAAAEADCNRVKRERARRRWVADRLRAEPCSFKPSTCETMTAAVIAKVRNGGRSDEMGCQKKQRLATQAKDQHLHEYA